MTMQFWALKEKEYILNVLKSELVELCVNKVLSNQH